MKMGTRFVALSDRGMTWKKKSAYVIALDPDVGLLQIQRQDAKYVTRIKIFILTTMEITYAVKNIRHSA